MKTSGNKRSLDEILQSCSDILFPAELGEAKVEINTKDVEGDTPLHVMAWRKDHVGAKLLISNGANINAVGDMGETPLQVAISQNDEQIVELLLRAGAVTNIRSEFGMTADERAVEVGGEIYALFKKNSGT